MPSCLATRLQNETAELNQRIQKVTSPVSVVFLDLLMIFGFPFNTADIATIPPRIVVPIVSADSK